MKIDLTSSRIVFHRTQLGQLRDGWDAKLIFWVANNIAVYPYPIASGDHAERVIAKCDEEIADMVDGVLESRLDLF